MNLNIIYLKEDNMSETRVVVNAPMKNVAVSVLLTIFFGGFGLLYSTVKGGIIMSIIEFINFWLCFLIRVSSKTHN